MPLWHRVANLLGFGRAVLLEKVKAVLRFRAWRFARSLDPSHAAYPLALDDFVAPCIEYFLTLRRVRGFSGKLREFRETPAGRDSSNARDVAWASCCAELGAIMIIGRTLRLPIVDFDITSIRADRSGSNCDLAFEFGEVKYLVEVKRKAAEDKQQAPQLLLDSLTQLKLPCSVTLEVRDRKYDCRDMAEKLKLIQEHVALHQASQDLATSAPGTLRFGQFSVHFLAGHPGSVGQYFQPDYLRDIKSHLLGDGRPLGDPKRKTPMVEAAHSKGADILACRVSDRDGIDRVVEFCFPSRKRRSELHFNVAESTLRGLAGVLLFARYDSFRLVTLDRQDLNSLTAKRRLITRR